MGDPGQPQVLERLGFSQAMAPACRFGRHYDVPTVGLLHQIFGFMTSATHWGGTDSKRRPIERLAGSLRHEDSRTLGKAVLCLPPAIALDASWRADHQPVWTRTSVSNNGIARLRPGGCDNWRRIWPERVAHQSPAMPIQAPDPDRTVPIDRFQSATQVATGSHVGGRQDGDNADATRYSTKISCWRAGGHALTGAGGSLCKPPATLRKPSTGTKRQTGWIISRRAIKHTITAGRGGRRAPCRTCC